jgi:GNAT superfamily N-acetyltransferase
LDGNRIDEETLEGYLNDAAVSILKYTNDVGLIKACVYLEKKENEMYLGMLSVYPEMQATGIGRLLLQEAEKLALQENKSVITITVISTRVELIAWYERRGYIATGEVLPFHAEEKFGRPKELIELIVMKKSI